MRLHTDPSSSLQIWLPAIVALVVVIAGSIVQWVIAWRQWKEQSASLDRQLTAQRELLEQQLSAQRDQTERQIVASLRSKTRLEWISELRELIAALYTAAVHRIASCAQKLAAAERKDMTRAAHMLTRGNRALRDFTTVFQKLQLHLDPASRSEELLLRQVYSFNEAIMEEPDTGEAIAKWVEQVGRIREDLTTSAWKVIREHYEVAVTGN